jgi:aryl-alcohol dehydrogenase-like predicted oxidoreductase
MEYTIFGPTNKKIFRIGLGTYGHGEAYGGITKEESLQILHAAAKFAAEEANLLIDTAPRYGNGVVETWIGEFLRKTKKNNILIATKGGRHIEKNRVNEKDFSTEFLYADLEGSLQRLGLKKIFLYQLHNPTLDVIMGGAVFDILENMRKQKKIEWYGVSIDSAEEGMAVINICRKKGYKGLASLQLIYNIFQKNVLDELCKKAHESGIAIIAREPLLRGFLTNLYNANNLSDIPPAPKKILDFYGKENIISKVETLRKFLYAHYNDIPVAQTALNFVLTNPHINVVIPGINREKYVEDDFLNETKINPSLISRLNQLEDLIKL